MKRILLISVCAFALIISGANAATPGYISSGDTAKETLSIFREAQGVDLDIDSKKKLATVSLLKDISADNIFKFQIIGKFAGTDTELANEDGLANDVTLKVTQNLLFFRDKITDDRHIAAERAAGSLRLRKTLDQCALNAVPTADGSSPVNYFSNLKGAKKTTAETLCAEHVLAKNKYEAETSKITLYRAYRYFNYSFAYTPGDYKYYDAATDMQLKSDTESFSVGSEIGFIEILSAQDMKDQKGFPMDSYKWSIGAEYVKGDAREEKSKTSICQPLNGSETVTKCFDTFLLPAYENEVLNLYASVGMRARNSWVKGAELIVKHAIIDKKYSDSTRDIDDSRLSVEAPLTLFVTDKYDVRAGLKFSWREKIPSDNDEFDEFTVGLFVTKGFDFEL